LEHSHLGCGARGHLARSWAKSRQANAKLTLRVARRASLIMGDKSPKANQKKAQQKAKANNAAQKERATGLSAKAAPRKK